ncbi:MAG: hypothetical protein DRP35_02370 [Candidatus Zixiibacteriota bacterium]|nr:MAG: hypothetical protein DRP35_02370 [candidate division Zixibacteria bacterium]
MNLDVLNNLDSIKEFISSFIETAQEFILSMNEFIQSNLGDSAHSVLLLFSVALGFFIIYKVVKLVIQLVTYLVVAGLLGLALYSYKYILN